MVLGLNGTAARKRVTGYKCFLPLQGSVELHVERTRGFGRLSDGTCVLWARRREDEEFVSGSIIVLSELREKGDCRAKSLRLLLLYLLVGVRGRRAYVCPVLTVFLNAPGLGGGLNVCIPGQVRYSCVLFVDFSLLPTIPGSSSCGTFTSTFFQLGKKSEVAAVVWVLCVEPCNIIMCAMQHPRPPYTTHDGGKSCCSPSELLDQLCRGSRRS